ncbi:hypothetical protein [Schleiferilactobacillus perolens]|jgi:hypothetical protein|uniref:Uncharacterized protein n=1 Tax=Schleiferilactobacillus perolens DSM 12744 TaxID=1423792 RepID=A0A0R1MSM6_9LACO|nr:hypothetical protein [Schleiferilactobacillus perolens]KRL11055.1 hypothetical protein FD09_GL000779 [Schleiferilactobacillus perolens DSM 12744]MCI1913608.1 hypothetical protein [Schleiferilactobacillus harbinensis]MCI2170569.1 hypothetical protein [Schleiferilactobacillus perolens]
MTTDPLAKQIAQAAAGEKDYTARAILTELAALAEEQARRITQTGGEIDGRAWNHEQW